MANTDKHIHIGNNIFNVNMHPSCMCIDSIIYYKGSLIGFIRYTDYILVNGYKLY